MEKPQIKLTILKEHQGYSAFAKVKDSFIATEADDFNTLKINFLEALRLNFEKENWIFTFDEFKIEYDLESFFAFYKVINAKALSERIGMNQSLLAQYIKGIKKPSTRQTKRILKGVQQIGKELSEVSFLL